LVASLAEFIDAVERIKMLVSTLGPGAAPN
jgi:hypothetical protein